MIQAGSSQTATLILRSLAVVARSWEHGQFDSPPTDLHLSSGTGNYGLGRAI